MIEIFFPLDWGLLQVTDRKNEHGAVSIGNGMMYCQLHPNTFPESKIVQNLGFVWRIPKLYEEAREPKRSRKKLP